MRHRIKMILILLVLLVVPACQTAEETQNYERINSESMLAPTYIGCLPDGRALFVVKYHPQAGNGQRSIYADRIYMTLDGETTTVQTVPSGKTTRNQSVYYPGAERDIPQIETVKCKPGEVI